MYYKTTVVCSLYAPKSIFKNNDLTVKLCTFLLMTEVYKRTKCILDRVNKLNYRILPHISPQAQKIEKSV